MNIAWWAGGIFTRNMYTIMEWVSFCTGGIFAKNVYTAIHTDSKSWKEYWIGMNNSLLFTRNMSAVGCTRHSCWTVLKTNLESLIYIYIYIYICGRQISETWIPKTARCGPCRVYSNRIHRNVQRLRTHNVTSLWHYVDMEHITRAGLGNRPN